LPDEPAPLLEPCTNIFTSLVWARTEWLEMHKEGDNLSVDHVKPFLEYQKHYFGSPISFVTQLACSVAFKEAFSIIIHYSKGWDLGITYFKKSF
jgi:hypothetical protein